LVAVGIYKSRLRKGTKKKRFANQELWKTFQKNARTLSG